MDRGGTRHYRLLAEILIEALAAERDPRAKAMAAGRAWGQKLDASLQSQPSGATNAEEATEKAIARLVGVLDEIGFAPERRTCDGEQQIGLRHCPFLELAEIRASVVCPLHLGLMQGALETWAAPVWIDRLEAFAEPDLCLAHVTPVGAA
jgi:predicted ArsR family transcriptional regulator